jgi:hypothetical protein
VRFLTIPGPRAREIAYVYNLGIGNPAVPIVTCLTPNPQANDRFGNSVAILGKLRRHRRLARRSQATDIGSATVYDLDGSDPTLPAYTLINPDIHKAINSAMRWRFSGTRVVVAANNDDQEEPPIPGAPMFMILAGATPTIAAVVLNNPAPLAQ